MKTRRLLAASIACAVILLGGCRNPFNPNARVRFDRFYAGSNMSAVMVIKQNEAGTMATAITKLTSLQTIAQISNASTVNGKITGYNVVYRQLSDGLPISACGGAAGRRFSTLIQVPALLNNTSQEAITGAVVMIITDELLTHISTNLSTIDGGIDCEVTFYGEDDNGYDIQVDGVLHIDVL